MHTFQRVTDQFTQVLGVAGPQAEELARKASQNIEAVSQASTVLTNGAQEISREWFDVMRERLAKNIEDMNRLASCRSVQDLIAVQSEIVRDRLGHTVDSSRRIAEVSIRVADEAARIIQISSKSKRKRFARGGVAVLLKGNPAPGAPGIRTECSSSELAMCRSSTFVPVGE